MDFGFALRRSRGPSERRGRRREQRNFFERHDGPRRRNEGRFGREEGGRLVHCQRWGQSGSQGRGAGIERVNSIGSACGSFAPTVGYRGEVVAKDSPKWIAST